MALLVAAGVDQLKLGITGWAQINGRDEISIEAKVTLEKEYLARRSMWFDLMILVKIFTSVLFSKGGTYSSSSILTQIHSNINLYVIKFQIYAH
jgi:O-antigen biosynthesis protein WbqP